MNKQEYRQNAKEIRKGLDTVLISCCVQEQIRNLNVYNDAQSVMLYFPKAGELDLSGLVNDSKNFYLPRMNGNEIVPCPWNKDDKLVLSNYKIFEPCTEPAEPDDIDLIILPGLCADINKNRLGYGKGCYDSFLEKCKALTIFAVPDELIFDCIPVEAHDKKADIVVSQSRIIS